MAIAVLVVSGLAAGTGCGSGSTPTTSFSPSLGVGEAGVAPGSVVLREDTADLARDMDLVASTGARKMTTR